MSFVSSKQEISDSGREYCKSQSPSSIFKPSGSVRKVSAPCRPVRSYWLATYPPRLPDSVIRGPIHWVQVVPALGFHEGEPAAETGAVGLFCVRAIEDEPFSVAL